MSEEFENGMTETLDEAGVDEQDANAGVDAAGADGKENQDAGADNADRYGSPENFDYSEVELPENMVLDNDLVNEFNPLAKELNLSNKSANKLMNLAVKLTQKNTAKFVNEFAAQYQDAEVKSYLQMLNTDKELNAYSEEEYSQYLSTANLGIKSVATDGFKNLLKQKGLTNHPEFIKTFHAIGKLCQNDTLPDVKNPVGSSRSAADILYGSSES
jgi:hypothetical protein